MKAMIKAQLKAYTADLKTEAEGFKAVSKGSNGEYSISFAKAGITALSLRQRITQ